MPNRILRESITSSPTLDRLSAEAERLFYRLTVVADDFGRFEADLPVLLARCFPRRVGSWRPETIGRWYAELEATGLVETYTVGERRYGAFITAARYFTRRAKTSKYPAPASGRAGDQMRTDEGRVNADADIYVHGQQDSMLASARTRSQMSEDAPEERGTRNEERGSVGHGGRPPRDPPGRADRGTRVPDPFPGLDETTAHLAWELGFRGRRLEATLAEFVDHWKGVPGAKGRKLDWMATLRNRLRDLADRPGFVPTKATEPYYAETATGVVVLERDDPRHPDNGGTL